MPIQMFNVGSMYKEWCVLLTYFYYIQADNMEEIFALLRENNVYFIQRTLNVDGISVDQVQLISDALHMQHFYF